MFNLDHDDFNKAKKAVIAAALALSVSYRLTLKENTISVASLKVDLTLEQLRSFSDYAFYYFLFVFILLYIDKFRSDRLKRVAEVSIYRQEIENFSGVEREAARHKMRVSDGRYRLMFVVDLGVPLIVSTIAVVTKLNPEFHA